MSKQSDLISVSQGAAGDPLFIDTVNDRIGIGTVTPNYALEINSSGSGDVILSRQTGIDGADLHWLETSVSPTNNLVTFKSTGSSNGGFTFKNASTDFMHITSTGDVGIGTSSPGSRLTIQGSAGNSAISYVAPDATVKGFTGVTAAGNYIVGAAAGETFVRSDGVGIAFSANTGASVQMRIDSAGRVTMPYQPAMHGKLTSTTTFNGGDLYKPDSVNVNIGNHYSSATGLFTAPVGGLYQISGTFLVRGAGSTGASLSVFPYYNGVVATSYGAIYQASFSTENAVAGVYLVPLSANDTLGLALTSSGTISLYGTENFMSIRFLG
jgi:hypothetical protein